MAVGAIPPMDPYKSSVVRMRMHSPRPAEIHPPSFILPPLTALFRAIDVQNMESPAHSRHGALEEVVYYVNRDHSGWVEQRVTRRVYIELKLECTRNRKRDVHKARDDWLCLYCGGSFPSKLRLTDHRVVGCPSGPVDSKGKKFELPVYPNLKTAKQGKDLKLALQRGSGDLWDTLQHNGIWLELNPELQDPTFPPPGARVQVRRFLEPTLDNLTTSTGTTGGSARQKTGAQRNLKPRSSPDAATDVVDLGTDGNEDSDTPPPQPKKRSHSQMAGRDGNFNSPPQFKRVHRKPMAEPSCRTFASERPRANTGPSSHPPPGPPPQPLRVTPIQSRSPSPERGAILCPGTPVAPVPQSAPVSSETPIHANVNSGGEQDVAARLRQDRQAFYLKAAAAARAEVRMDTTKPPLMPPVAPPGLFHLLQCGLLKYDLDQGSFAAFHEEVDNWRNDPSCMVTLWAAYGRFHSPTHQVQSLLFTHSVHSF